MKKLASLVLLVIALTAAVAFADDVQGLCINHPTAYCYDTGLTKYSGGHEYEKWHCSCGDDVYALKN
jgi:hypothetical protein